MHCETKDKNISKKFLKKYFSEEKLGVERLHK